MHMKNSEDFIERLEACTKMAIALNPTVLEQAVESVGHGRNVHELAKQYLAGELFEIIGESTLDIARSFQSALILEAIEFTIALLRKAYMIGLVRNSNPDGATDKCDIGKLTDPKKSSMSSIREVIGDIPYRQARKKAPQILVPFAMVQKIFFFRGSEKELYASREIIAMGMRGLLRNGKLLDLGMSYILMPCESMWQIDDVFTCYTHLMLNESINGIQIAPGVDREFSFQSISGYIFSIKDTLYVMDTNGNS